MNDGAAPVVGEFVTETFDYDARRAVTIYVPTKPHRRSRTRATVS